MLRTLAFGLADADIDILLCASDEGPFLPSGVTVISVAGITAADRAPALIQATRRFAPDVIMIMDTEGAACELLERLGNAAPGIPLYAYVPLEGRAERPGRLLAASRFGEIVLYTQTARRFTADATNEPFDGRFRHAIGHGVDTMAFHPLPAHQRHAQRVRLFGSQMACPSRLTEALLILNANRNDLRKRLDQTVTAFARFARAHENAYLVLHSAPVTPVADLRRMAKAVGLAGRVFFTQSDSTAPMATDADLNAIYNCCDVGLNTSRAEGWGLVPFEHAATGAMQIMTDTDTARELWGDAVMRVGDSPAACAPTFEDALAQAAHPAIRAGFADRAVALARSPANGWDVITGAWKTLLLQGLTRGTRV